MVFRAWIWPLKNHSKVWFYSCHTWKYITDLFCWWAKTYCSIHTSVCFTMSHFSSLSPVSVFRGSVWCRMCFPVYFQFTLFIIIANNFVMAVKNIFHVCLHPCFLANRSVHETHVLHPLFKKNKIIVLWTTTTTTKRNKEYQTLIKVKSNIILKHKGCLSPIS